MKKIALLVSLCLFTIGCNADYKQTNVTESVTETKTTTQTAVKDPKSAELFMEDYIKLTNKEALIKRFGKDNVKEGVTHYAEGDFARKHIIVTNTDTNQQVKYLLKEEDEKTISMIKFSHKLFDEEGNITKQKPIKSKNGISTGMPLSELLEWNDNETIYFSGFGWDFGGHLMGSEKYRKPDSKLAKSGFSIRLSFDGNLSETPDGLTGDVTLSTENKKVLDMPILVDEITVYLESFSD